MEARGIVLQGRLPCNSSVCVQRNCSSVLLQRNGEGYGVLVKSRRNAWLSGGVGGVSGSLVPRRGRGVRILSLWAGRNSKGRGRLEVRCNESDEVDMPPEDPAYTSYVDPNTGAPSPSYGTRAPLPPSAYWGDDAKRVARSGQASTPRDRGEMTRGSARSGRDDVSGRRSRNAQRVPNEFEEEFEEELEKEVEEEEEEEEELESGDHDEEEEEDSGIVSQRKEGLVPESDEPLANDELWWNFQKPPKDKEPWSAWQKRMGDSDSVMAAAMAKAGQIELFGDKPTIAEASLARARKRVFYEERMRKEEERREEVGAVAYYHEWVEKWKKDTSNVAVEDTSKVTGEGVVDQLLDMLQHQSQREYRRMQGTDFRIARDPLTLRMPEEEIKQVWGGDPVYPTKNYEQDPDAVADYRNENLHEPTPDIVDKLQDDGILITREELQEILDREEREEREKELLEDDDDGMIGAIDIGDKEDDEDEDDEDELDEEDDDNFQDDVAWRASISQHQLPSGKPKASREAKRLSPAIDLLDQIDSSDLLEYVGEEEDGEDSSKELKN
ncbi:protein PLASTID TRANSCRIPTIONALLY ACTIVE 12, chloroplastic [Physcomitrium patens]|uniref:Uncharacterized protein n=1 Tax=Physcomitrium patens TaxID=3218 RepID=A9SZ97_PHYPA|nr:protein PLASTID TRANSCRIPTIONALLY ACTIVE 12, chloroplastic-like [Physcomitrium patens]PNR46668.1 hypothetical protein PHYPA_013788 [Physcomitrium patens]|eukprot:XP_024387345.1 protein PLASTID TRANSCRIPTIONALLY ACTIVE 12, chloroplastic-like [Physcomitrella patens]